MTVAPVATPLTRRGIPVDPDLRVLALGSFANRFGSGAVLTTSAIYFTRHVGFSAAEVAAAEKADPGKPGQVAAPFQGVVTIVVAEGDQVAAGDTVATIEAMKMEASITAPVAGTVERLALGGTQAVDGGDLVLVLG